MQIFTQSYKPPRGRRQLQARLLVRQRVRSTTSCQWPSLHRSLQLKIGSVCRLDESMHCRVRSTREVLAAPFLRQTIRDIYAIACLGYPETHYPTTKRQDQTFLTIDDTSSSQWQGMSTFIQEFMSFQFNYWPKALLRSCKGQDSRNCNKAFAYGRNAPVRLTDNQTSVTSTWYR